MYIALHPVLRTWQAGVLECLITALRLNRNDPETLRWAAGALGSICSEDVGQLRERAVKVVMGEWPNETLIGKTIYLLTS